MPYFLSFVLMFFVMFSSACQNLNSNTLFQSKTRHVDEQGQYIVQKNDTLYSIAWRFKRDFRDLARLNNINPPYTIYVGQTLSLVAQGDEIPSKFGYTGITVADRSAPSTSQRSPSVPNTSRSSASVKNSQPKTRTIKPSAPSNTQQQGAKTSRQSAKYSSSKAKSTFPSSTNIRWQWPIKGKIIQTFSRSSVGKKGIQIAGINGTPIKAVAAGQVVYTGNSLVAYGNLVIVKHNDEFLSAYAHNRTILVREGDTVKQGQAIAELGASGTDRNKLHFEIRKNGKPVNPLNYLP